MSTPLPSISNIDKLSAKEKPHGDSVSVKSARPVTTRQTLHQNAFSVWTAMGIGHSITNTAITLIVGFASSISLGGPPLFFWGFISMIFVAFCVAISLGELASALPHTGGQYFWVATLAPPSCRRFLSYITGIVAWSAAVCTGASVCLAVSTMIFNMVALSYPSFVYRPWMGFLVYQFINILLSGFNIFAPILPWISRTLLFYTIITLIVIFVAVLAASPTKLSAGDVFLNMYNASGWPNSVSFLIGVNSPNWAFSCLDAVVHLADEIPHPRRNIPKALLITVALGTVTGILILIAMFFAASSVESIVSTSTPSLEIFLDAFSGSVAAALGLQTLVTISAAGAVIGVHTWQSRMAWSFARDKGFPFHKYLSKVAREPYGAPIYAHAWSCCWTGLLGCLYLGSELAFNSLVSGGILLQYITYSTSILCLLWYGRSNVKHGPFWFPKLGLFSNIVVIMWTLIALTFYSFPYYLPVVADQMNYVSCVIIGIFVFATIYWLFYGRKMYSIPHAEIYD